MAHEHGRTVASFAGGAVLSSPLFNYGVASTRSFASARDSSGTGLPPSSLFDIMSCGDAALQVCDSFVI